MSASLLSHHLTAFYGGNNLSTIAVEILFEIASHLTDNPSQLTAFMLTCRRMSIVGENIRYPTLTIQGYAGRRLLSMFLSGTVTSRRYCDTVTSLWFRGIAGEEPFWIYHLFSTSLILLRNLQTLWIEGVHLHAEQLVKSMTRANIVRQRYHPALSLKPLWAKNSGDSSPLCLPRLSHLRLECDAQVWVLASYRALTELDLDFTLSVDVFAEILECAEGSILGRSLSSLSVKLSRTIALDLALPMLSNAFTALLFLRLDAPGSEVKDVLGQFAHPSPTLPFLKRLICNPLYYPGARRPVHASSDPALVEEVQRFLPGVLCHHSALRRVEIGIHLWEIADDGRFYRTSGTEAGENFSDYPGKLFSRSRFPGGEDP